MDVTFIMHRLWRLVSPERVAGDLLGRAARPGLTDEELHALLDEIESIRREGRAEFGLVFTVGRLGELLADRRPREERPAWLQGAVSAYEDALRLAEAGRLAAADRALEASDLLSGGSIGVAENAVVTTCFRLGVLLCADFRVRDPARAIAFLQRVVAHRGDDPVGWYYLGEAYALAEDFDQAEHSWRAGLARAPEDAALLAVLRNLPADRVRHRAKRGAWAEVVQELARMPSGAMPRAERHALEGDARWQLGDLSAAATCYRAAIAADPRVVDVRRKLRTLERESQAASSQNESR